MVTQMAQSSWTGGSGEGDGTDGRCDDACAVAGVPRGKKSSG
jgi:hypothetical protein